ncbi:unnamed protein product [Cuscuta epithymum]|uniref:Ubiquitin-like protease family profile domain-containing protein n=3 Tax=Cuscuta epithymum TaxID=186058 RepID=A0AAV0BZJ7_9ASTE|nr:unnamed protein product [Cuscuta epithymum]
MKNIFTKLKPSKRGDDAVKLASLFYIECILLAKDNTTRINSSSVRLANDLEAFGKCPWSLQSYKILVKHMKDLMQDQPDKFQERKKKNPKYKNAKLSVYGFPLVLQVWAYEEIPEVGTHFANKVGNHDVPLLNWTAVPKFHYSKLRRLVFLEEEEKVSDSEEGEEEDETNEEDVQVFEKLKILEEMQNLRVCVEKVEKKITIVEDSISEIKVLLQKLIGNQNPSVQEEVDKVDNDDVVVQDEAAVEAEGENIVQTSDGEDAEVIHADAGQGEGQGPAADVPLKSTSVHEEGAAADRHGVAYRQLSPTADFTAHEDGVVKEVGDVSNPLKNEGGTRADLIISTVVTEVDWENEHNKHGSNFPDIMMCLNEDSQQVEDEQLPSVTAPGPFENLDWDGGDVGSTPLDVEPLEDVSTKHRHKRKRCRANYKCSPYLDPIIPIEPPMFHPSDDDIASLKAWIEEPDNVEPKMVVLNLPSFDEVDREFFRELVQPDETLWSYHMDALSYLLVKDCKTEKPYKLINPYFTHQLLSKDANDENVWTRDKYLPAVDWRGLEKVFVPLNVVGMHWVLAEIDLHAKLVRVYDSMRTSRSRLHAADLCVRLPLLFRVIQAHPDLSKVEVWKAKAVADVPQQEGGSICGLMVVAYAEALMLGLPMRPYCEYANVASKRWHFALRLWSLRQTVS